MQHTERSAELQKRLRAFMTTLDIRAVELDDARNNPLLGENQQVVVERAQSRMLADKVEVFTHEQAMMEKLFAHARPDQFDELDAMHDAWMANFDHRGCSTDDDLDKWHELLKEMEASQQLWPRPRTIA